MPKVSHIWHGFGLAQRVLEIASSDVEAVLELVSGFGVVDMVDVYFPNRLPSLALPV